MNKMSRLLRLLSYLIPLNEIHDFRMNSVSFQGKFDTSILNLESGLFIRYSLYIMINCPTGYKKLYLSILQNNYRQSQSPLKKFLSKIETALTFL